MSPIIKAHGSDGIRPFGASPRIGSTTVKDPRGQPPREDNKLEQLTRDNLTLREQLRELAASLEQAVKAAREEGRRQAQTEAVRDDQARIAALEAGVGSALAAWEQRLDGIETLAALLSRTALAKLFDQPDGQSEFVLECLARQLRHMRQQTILAICVSAIDFPDESALAQVGTRLAPGVPVSVSDELAAGECRIDLQVGHIDIGPATQWRRLSALLDELAGEDER